MSNVGVHQTHCCKLHGCKYGDENCPVVKNEIEQTYACMDCTEITEDLQEVKHSVQGFTDVLTLHFNKQYSTPKVDEALAEINRQIQIIEAEIKVKS